MVTVEWQIVLVQFITFVVGMIFVWKMMITPLLNTLSQRDLYIKNSLDKVEKDKADMATMKTDYEKQVQEMHAHSAAALNKAVADGEKIKESILNEAKTEGTKLLVEAKAEIETEKKKAIEAVKNAIVDISMMAAEKAIKKNISKKDQVSMVTDYLKDIGKSSN
ncbi:MAG: F0F1 ATP synthase subunit B [bacterium]